MKILVATEKPFAPVAVDGIKEVIAASGNELVLLEKGTKADLINAVADAAGLIVRSDIVDKEVLDAAKELKRIADMVKQAPRLTLEPNKTQYFHVENGVLTNCGKTFHENADDSSRTINFLGFSFDGQKVREPLI